MRAVILVEAGFQDEEYVYPYYRMREEGWTVAVATPDGKDRIGKYGVPARATLPIREVIPAAHDVLMIPGGFESPDRLRMREDVQRLVVTMHQAGKLIAAICHGPWVLVSAGICKGLLMTGYKSIEPDLRNAGAEYVDSAVVPNYAAQVVTAQHYRDNGDFMRAVIRCASTPTWGLELCGAAAR